MLASYHDVTFSPVNLGGEELYQDGDRGLDSARDSIPLRVWIAAYKRGAPL